MAIIKKYTDYVSSLTFINYNERNIKFIIKNDSNGQVMDVQLKREDVLELIVDLTNSLNEKK